MYPWLEFAHGTRRATYRHSVKAVFGNGIHWVFVAMQIGIHKAIPQWNSQAHTSNPLESQKTTQSRVNNVDSRQLVLK